MRAYFFTFFLFISSSYLYAKDCNNSDRTSFGVKQNSELTSTITEDDDPFKSSDEVPLYTGVIEPIHSAFKEQGYIKCRFTNSASFGVGSKKFSKYTCEDPKTQNITVSAIINAFGFFAGDLIIKNEMQYYQDGSKRKIPVKSKYKGKSKLSGISMKIKTKETYYKKFVAQYDKKFGIKNRMPEYNFNKFNLLIFVLVGETNTHHWDLRKSCGSWEVIELDAYHKPDKDGFRVLYVNAITWEHYLARKKFYEKK